MRKYKILKSIIVNLDGKLSQAGLAKILGCHPPEITRAFRYGCGPYLRHKWERKLQRLSGRKKIFKLVAWR